MKPDAILNALVCEHVCKWTENDSDFVPWKDAAGEAIEHTPEFTTDTDAILPWLEKEPHVSIDRVKGDGWQVAILDVEELPTGVSEGIRADAWEDTLAKAAVVALLRARGIDVD